MADDDLGGSQLRRKGWISRDGMRYRSLGSDGTIMRHFFGLLLTITSLPGSMIQSTLQTCLIPLRCSVPGFQTCWQSTFRAVDVTPITATTDLGQSMASGAVVHARGVVDQYCFSLGHDIDLVDLHALLE